MENFVNRLSGFMSYVTAKRDVVSNNISNSNTPNYKAKDVTFLEQLEGSNSTTGTLGLRTVDDGAGVFQTNANHLPLSSSTTSNSYQIKTKSGSVNADGNGVDVTTEMIELMKVNQLYSTAVTALNTQSSINSAARGK